MIEITSYFSTNEEGYIINKRTQEVATFGENKKPILLYQENITDNEAYILNPLAEGLGPMNLPAREFYRLQEAALAGRLFSLFSAIIRLSIASKKYKAGDGKPPEMPFEFVELSGKIIDDVDDTTLKELSQLIFGDRGDDKPRDGQELIKLYYQKNNIRYVMRTGLFDEPSPDDTHATLATYRSKHPKIRKKSWGVFEKLMLGVFGITHHSEFDKFYTKGNPDVSCIKLDSYIRLLIMIYIELNPYFAANDDDIDLSKLHHHCRLLSHYADIARFMIHTENAPPASREQVPGGWNNAVPTTSVPGVVPGAWRPQNPTPTSTVPVGGINTYGAGVSYGAPPPNPWVAQGQPVSAWGQPAPSQYGMFQPSTPNFSNTTTPPFDPPYSIVRPTQQYQSSPVTILPPNMPTGIWRP
ncbi:unnamed protein product [Sphagnum jensenii]|uniref:Uncharacterized protein n=1 Tax=Sphagnum jensenii TaxID=128206 RepID=A0ABP0VG89_9BRYO